MPASDPLSPPVGRHFADLHVHSRYSRATSQAITPESLDHWARRKGLALVGTGDLTHPLWLDELEKKLTLDQEGLYALKEGSNGTRFVPTGEVSAIYKQGGRTRRIHLVVVAPDLAAARRFSQALATRGNVHSDGRPILGLSARNVLEIALTADPQNLVIPAHVWTPWFSLFGQKSGFDRVEECFQDLSGHITALETGLSSDPAMNRLVSALDSYHLVSSSDAHSPEKLGREATVLAGAPSRAGLWAALTRGDGLLGTVEFFPEEGKYHLDGHAHCGPALTPAQTREAMGLCPVCGRPLTIGVLSRVLELADREEPGPTLPDWHVLPLIELLAQALGQGPGTQAVKAFYERLLGLWPSEYGILLEAPLEELKELAGPLVALGVERMRAGEVLAKGGYDGLFGVIEVVSERDRDEARGQGFLFPGLSRRGRPAGRAAGMKPKGQKGGPEPPTVVRRKKEPAGALAGLSLEQKAAVIAEAKSLAILAGPGSGKTLALVRRAAYQIRRLNLSPSRVLMTTYTRKAAETLAERLLDPTLGLEGAEKVVAKTLHALAYQMAKKRAPDWELAPADFLANLLKTQAGPLSLAPARLGQAIAFKKNAGRFPAGLKDLELAESLAQGYQAALEERRYWDFDDLILWGLKEAPGGFDLILADEFQDFSAAQRDFLLHLAKRAPLTVIGDPDQSVYGFRGARAEIFEDLATSRPDLETLELTANYRSTCHICQAAERSRPYSPAGAKPRRCAYVGPTRKVLRLTCDTPRDEARLVVERLKAHLGALDLGLGGRASRELDALDGLALGDAAIVFRWRSQAAELATALDEAGLPYQLAGEEERTAADGLDFKADKVNLLTIHAAKGLEFRLVFLVGLEEGLFPETRENDRAPLDLEEEARLFYVALTRARERLYLTRAVKRRHYGRFLPGQPSPFWSRLDRLCLDRRPNLAREKTATLF